MTCREMEERFREIAEKDTTLDKREQAALVDQYIYAWDAADLVLLQEELQNRLARIAGALDYLCCTDKIKDEENLWMLMNEIEAYASKRAEEFAREGQT